MTLSSLPLRALRAHPMNANAMKPEQMTTLRRHIEKTGHYPPLIVRPLDQTAPTYQVLDGHHRWRVLEELGHTEAQCVIWPVDDQQAMMLLATLNRLAGQDDPQRRGELLASLRRCMDTDAGELARWLPETAEQVRKLADLADVPPPRPAQPPKLDDMPVSVHFFLSPADKARLENVLARHDGSRELALMRIVDQVEQQ